MKQISDEIEESSNNLGATSSVTFRKITLPLIRPAFFSGATFALMRSMTAISTIFYLYHYEAQRLGSRADFRNHTVIFNIKRPNQRLSRRPGKCGPGDRRDQSYN